MLFSLVLVLEIHCEDITFITFIILMIIMRCEFDPESRSINHLCVIECWATRLVVQRDTPVIILTSLHVFIRDDDNEDDNHDDDNEMRKMLTARMMISMVT